MNCACVTHPISVAAFMHFHLNPIRIKLDRSVVNSWSPYHKHSSSFDNGKAKHLHAAKYSIYCVLWVCSYISHASIELEPQEDCQINEETCHQARSGFSNEILTYSSLWLYYALQLLKYWSGKRRICQTTCYAYAYKSIPVRWCCKNMHNGSWSCSV